MEEWPAPIIRFTSASPGPMRFWWPQRTHALLMEDKAEAKRQFKLARDTCNKNDTEYGISLAELRRLDADKGN
jgi:hypothetical protein